MKVKQKEGAPSEVFAVTDCTRMPTDPNQFVVTYATAHNGRGQFTTNERWVREEAGGDPVGGFVFEGDDEWGWLDASTALKLVDLELDEPAEDEGDDSEGDDGESQGDAD